MSVTNIFLFRDIIKVKIGIGSPGGVTNPTDGQSVTEGSLTYVYDTSTASWNITTQTNQIFVSGLTTDPSTVTFSSGKIIKNGVDSGTSVSVSDGDIVRLSVTNPTLNSTNNYTFDVDGTTLEFNVELNDPQTANYDVEVTKTLTLAAEPEREVQNTNTSNNSNFISVQNTNTSNNSNFISDLQINKTPNSYTEEIKSVKETAEKYIQENIGNILIDPDAFNMSWISEVSKSEELNLDFISNEEQVTLREWILAYMQDTELKTLEYKSEDEIAEEL